MGLLAAMRRSLAELDLGLKGDLTMSEVTYTCLSLKAHQPLVASRACVDWSL